MSHIINAVTIASNDAQDFNDLIAKGLKLGAEQIKERGYDMRNLTEEIQYNSFANNYTNSVMHTALITWREKL